MTLKGPQRSSVQIGSTWWPDGECVADISLNAVVCHLLVDKRFSVLECAPCAWANCFTPEALAFMTWVGKLQVRRINSSLIRGYSFLPQFSGHVAVKKLAVPVHPRNNLLPLKAAWTPQPVLDLPPPQHSASIAWQGSPLGWSPQAPGLFPTRWASLVTKRDRLTLKGIRRSVSI